MTVPAGRTRRGVLRQAAQFEAVLRAGIRVVTPNFVARALANDTTDARLGMIAGKKAAPRAVDRNRAKRLMRENFRLVAPRFGAHDVTIQLRTDLRSLDNSAVRTELQTLFQSLVRRCANANRPPSAPRAAPTSSDRQ